MRVMGWVAAAAMMLGAGAAAAQRFDRLYVFGDSLVDSGNARVLAPDKVPPSGRFTNGENFADDVSRALGFGPATAYLNGGTNFAVGGATAAYYDGESSPDLGTQFKGPPTGVGAPPYPYNYTTAIAVGSAPAIDARSLVIVTIGGNDVRDYATGGSPTPAQTIAALQTSLTDLVGAGARNIVLVGLPDIGLIPEVVNTPLAESASLLSAGLNVQYRKIADAFAAQLDPAGGLFTYFDLAGLQQAITRSPAAYGLDPSLLKTDCVDGGALATNCAGYAYYDRIHPTAQLHGLIVAGILAQLPEPSSWALMIVGFGFTGVALRRRRRAALA